MNLRLAAICVAVLALAACDRMPGRPGPREEVPRPEQVLDFNTLYKENCSGCHGADGKGSAAIALRDPVFLTLADDAAILAVASGGVPGTQMPPFAQSKGGMLTDEQIGVLVHGIRSWARPDAAMTGLPPYAGSPGDPQRGAVVFATFCSSCHGPKGDSSIANPTYLALVSDQYLRTIAIAGRPELGAPDWRGDVPGRPMSAGEVSDVVAWLASQRSTSK
jgi:mono/diheme cytochrome c family protein